MDIIERVNKRIGQQTPPVQPIRQAAQGTILPTRIEQPNIKPGTDTRDWRRTASYDEAVKIDPTLTRAGYIGGVSQYRAENGMQPLSFAELYSNLAGHNPFQSAEQEAKQEQKLRRAERVNAIGNVLANLVNYVRTVNGNPAMRLQPIAAGQQRIDQLRVYQDALDNSRYKDYMAILGQQRAEDAARDAAAQKFQQQIFLENLRQNSPLAQAQARRAGAEALRAETQAQYAEAYEKSKIRRNDEAAGASRASATASYARANASNGNSRYYGEFRGKNYKTQADYDSAVLEAAKALGIPLFKEEIIEKNEDGSMVKTTKRVPREISDLAAEVRLLDEASQDKYASTILSSDKIEFSQDKRNK